MESLSAGSNQEANTRMNILMRSFVQNKDWTSLVFSLFYVCKRHTYLTYFKPQNQETTRIGFVLFLWQKQTSEIWSMDRLIDPHSVAVFKRPSILLRKRPVQLLCSAASWNFNAPAFFWTLASDDLLGCILWHSPCLIQSSITSTTRLFFPSPSASWWVL